MNLILVPPPRLRLIFACVILFLVLSSSSFAQVILRDTVRIQTPAVLSPTGCNPNVFCTFLVVCTPESVAVGDTSNITVIAVDGVGEEVFFERTATMRLIADDSACGNFINASGDTVPGWIESVTYGDLRDGKYKYLAKMDSSYRCGYVYIRAQWPAGNVENDGVIYLKPGLEILLGQTKYYRAKNHPTDTNKLIIEETAEPVIGDAIAANVWGTNPVTIIDGQGHGRRMGVYWEKEKPKPDGSGDLLLGLIRLVGRFWHPDSVYKVGLSAGHQGRTGSIEIEVKKPRALGNTYRYAHHINGSTLVNFDSLMILYAGTSGIPPQQLKGQVSVEAHKEGQVFWPTYRYEPWRDLYFRIQPKRAYARDYMDHPFWANSISMDPDDVPTSHLNVKPLNYSVSPITIGNYLAANLFQYTKGSGKKRSIIDKEFLTNMYRVALRYYMDELRLSQSVAQDSADQMMRDYFTNAYDDVWAQTRKAASYGFFQMLYTTAIESYVGYPKSYSYLPENLSHQDVLFPRVKNKLIHHVRRVLKNQTWEDSNWQLGFEGTWRECYRSYNERPGYNKDVMDSSLSFAPALE
jgi:hypothetical protein